MESIYVLPISIIQAFPKPFIIILTKDITAYLFFLTPLDYTKIIKILYIKDEPMQKKNYLYFCILHL